MQRIHVLAWHWQRTWTAWSRLRKQTQHSGSAEGTQARGHCAHLVTIMCASGKNRRRCVKQDHVALLFQATTVPAVPWPCTTGASTCASHCTSTPLRSPPAGQVPALYMQYPGLGCRKLCLSLTPNAVQNLYKADDDVVLFHANYKFCAILKLPCANFKF